MLNVQEQLKIIKRGAVEIISEEELALKLKESIKNKRPLNIKAGFDPTAPDIHLGHTVILRKLRQFQDLGHKVYFLIGDFTALIGDPSGRSAIRKPMTKPEIIKNALTYKKQAGKILELRRLKIVFNSQWFKRMRLAGFLKLAGLVTVSQMIARQDFKERLKQNQDVSLLEFMYPVLQGYDSVVLKSDIEVGGTDQIFNLLVGRDLQKDFGQPPQVVLTMPLLEGTDGINKMSKSLDNYIAINDKPSQIFGKTMSISDELMHKYYTLLTDVDMQAIKEMHPRQAKAALAKAIICQYYGSAEAEKASDEFQRIFSEKKTPLDLALFTLNQPLAVIDIIVASGLARSKNEARRLIQQGGVDFEDKRISDENLIISSSGVLKVGSRRFLKLEYKKS